MKTMSKEAVRRAIRESQRADEQAVTVTLALSNDPAGPLTVITGRVITKPDAPEMYMWSDQVRVPMDRIVSIAAAKK